MLWSGESETAFIGNFERTSIVNTPSILHRDSDLDKCTVISDDKSVAMTLSGKQFRPQAVIHHCRSDKSLKSFLGNFFSNKHDIIVGEILNLHEYPRDMINTTLYTW